MRRMPLLIANWKMHKTVRESLAFALELKNALADPGRVPQDCDLVVAPTYPAIWAMAEVLSETPVTLAAQSLDLGREGALTGAVSGYLLKEAGAQWVIVGHSERRREFGEDSQTVAEKALAAVQSGLNPVLCVGETEAQRRQNRTEAVLCEQLDPVIDRLAPLDWDGWVVAYEPVWAIGSGQIPEMEAIDRIAGLIRRRLVERAGEGARRTRILYGGSVQEDNIAQIWRLPSVDGALVGGASLQCERYLTLAAARPGPEKEMD